MSNQRPSDQINKAVYFLVEEIKNAVALNLTTVAMANQIDPASQAHQKLLATATMSIDEGFSKGRHTFERLVEKALDDHMTDVIESSSAENALVVPSPKLVKARVAQLKKKTA